MLVLDFTKPHHPMLRNACLSPNHHNVLRKPGMISLMSLKVFGVPELNVWVALKAFLLPICQLMDIKVVSMSTRHLLHIWKSVCLKINLKNVQRKHGKNLNQCLMESSAHHFMWMVTKHYLLLTYLSVDLKVAWSSTSQLRHTLNTVYPK
jgi:hypothetical protein